MKPFQVLCSYLIVAGTAAMARPAEDLPIQNTFNITITKGKQPDLTTGFIATDAKWKDIWTKVAPSGKVPAVNFTKNFVLVTKQDAADPNHVSLRVRRDDQGVVFVSRVSTLIGFEGSDRIKYRFHVVSREGVTGVIDLDRVDLGEKPKINPLPN